MTKIARHVRRGDIIKVQMAPDTEPQEEVVRAVSVILHMANGNDVRLEPTDEVEVLPPEVVDEGE